MQGQPEIVELLNEVLTAELTAVNQYFAHAKLCQNWGFLRLAERTRTESMGEMRHAERVIERILYLEGMPNLQRLGSVRVGESVPEQFSLDLELERVAVAHLNKGVATCRQAGDNGTRELLEAILDDEEGHVDWLETQLFAIGQVGEANYLAQQLYG